MAQKPKRIQKSQELNDCFQYVSLKSLRDTVDKLIDQYGPEAVFDVDIEEYPYNGGNKLTFSVNWHETETPEQMKERLAKERRKNKERREQKRAKDLRELARLQKLYGDKA